MFIPEEEVKESESKVIILLLCMCTVRHWIGARFLYPPIIPFGKISLGFPRELNAKK
jgi:hypothetical protein